MPFSGYFTPFIYVGIVVVPVILAILKLPLYFMIARVFLYHVSRPVPLSALECLAIAVMLAGIGAPVMSGLVLLSPPLMMFGPLVGFALLCVLLSGARTAAWWVVGRSRPRLRGRALRQFVTVGVSADVVCDLVLLLTLAQGVWVFGVAFVLMLIATPFALAFGRRSDVVSRFAGKGCAGCGYDLRGNHMGYCPECGLSSGGAPTIRYGDYDDK